MPAKSVAQQQAMAIALHSPEKLYARNKGLKEMTHKQLHDFASTSHSHFSERVHHEYSNASYSMAHKNK